VIYDNDYHYRILMIIVLFVAVKIFLLFDSSKKKKNLRALPVLHAVTTKVAG